MKYLVIYTQFLFLILIANQLDSQEVSKVDHTNNEYFSLEEALVNPDLVYSLSLDNENILRFCHNHFQD